jgi:hypothetical protein
VTAEQLWVDTERFVVDHDERIAGKLQNQFEEFRSDINRTISGSFSRWWTMHVMAWRDGFAGFEAQQQYESLDLAPWP